MIDRRTFLLGSGAAVLLAGCGSDADGGSGAAGGSSAGGPFPVTITHKYGSTTVRAAPRRVAAVGGSDPDTLLALGIVPVLVPEIETRWASGLGPWATPKLGGAEPTVMKGFEIAFERVASTRPDLITGVESEFSRGDYDKLARLAPTVPPPKGYPVYGVPWDLMALQVAKAVGLEARGEELVAAQRAQFAQVKRDNPRFERSTALLVTPNQEGGIYLFSNDDIRTHFLADLGMEQPAAIAELFGGDDFYVDVSEERLDIVDEADLLVVTAALDGERKALERSPTWERLKAVREGRVVLITEPDLAAAMAYSTVLSMPYQLERLVPRMREALAT